MKKMSNLKKIMMTSLSVLAVTCAFAGTAILNATVVRAEETTIPVVTDGSRIEMESVTPNGTPTNGNDTMVFDKETASGGAVIGNWGKGDNNVTYKFTVEQATRAQIGIALVTGWGGTNLITRVNGKDVSFVDSFDPFTDWDNGWYNFKVYNLEEVDLVAGENTIYFEAYEGSNFNFDYITFTFIASEEPVVEIPVVTDGSRIEMESVTPNGTPTSGNESMVFDKATASGGAVIGNWGNGDNNVTYKFTVEQATRAQIGIALVTGWGGTNLVTRVNGVDVAFADSFDPFTDWDNGWYNFKVYNLEEVDLVAGENTIYFEAYEGSNFNFDYITFTFIASEEPVVEIPLVTDGSRIEMESVTPNGTPTNGNDTMVFDKETASGGAVIGNWGNGDNNVTYKFTVEEATRARIGIALVTGWGGTNLITRVNGVDVSFVDSFDPFTDWDNGWYNFKVYNLEEVDLVAGENTLYLEAYEGSNFNFDYFTFTFIAKGEEGHVCEYVDGKCACGNLKIEVESVTPNGTPTDENSTFIFDKETASGGKVIGNWGKGDTNVTYTFTVEEAGYARVGIALVTGWSGTQLLTKVNGVEVKFTSSFAPFTDWNNGWYNFKVYYLEVAEVVVGENTIYLEAYEGSNFNFDYILVEFVEKPEHVCKSVCEICGKCLNAECEEEVCADKCQGHHKHSWTDGRCECGAALLEAEDTDWANTIESTDSSGAGVIVEQTELASGGYIVGNWGKTGNKIVWAIELDKAATASMTLYAAPCSPANNFSAVMKLTVNGVEVGLVNDAMPGLVGSAWYDFKAFETNAVEFPAGKVTIVLEMLVDEYYTNVDCLVIALPSDVAISATDGVAPEISDIEVTSADLTAGKEIEFTYTVSDNKTATENITVETKVYLNYNRDTQEEIACANNKFTPAKEGRYTIVITATDEAGNTTTQTRSLSIDAAPDVPDNPNSSETPDSSDTPDSSKTPDSSDTPDASDTSDKPSSIWDTIKGLIPGCKSVAGVGGVLGMITALGAVLFLRKKDNE